jgi:hypothetical protein
MNMIEILEHEAEKNGVDKEMLKEAIAILHRDHQAQALEHGDSVLVYVPMEPGVAYLHLFTKEGPLALHKTINYFIHALLRVGIRVVYGKADNDQIIRMMQSVGMTIRPSDNPKFNWMSTLG